MTFKALILVGGASGGGAHTEERIHAYTKIGVQKYHIQHLENLVSAEFPKTKLGRYLLDTFAERGPRLSGESIAQIFRARAAIDLEPRLASLRVPALVINGEYDSSLEAGRRTASMIPGATHKVLPKTGHACCLEDPAGFDAFVVEFLSSRGLMPSTKR